MGDTVQCPTQQLETIQEYSSKIQKVCCELKNAKRAEESDARAGVADTSTGDIHRKRRSLSPILDGPSSKKRKQQALERENEECRQKISDLEKQLHQAKAQSNELSFRLSKEMEVKISRDETNLENICVKNRPMNVAEEYQMFCSDAWLDAKSALDDFMDNPSKESEMERVALLHDILMVAQTVTSAILDDMLAQISAPLEQIDQPVLFFDKKAKQVKYEKHPKGGRKLQFQHFDNAVRDIIRGRADNVDCRQFLKLAYAELEEFHPEATDVIKAVHEVDTYIEKACGLAWKMAIQRPKLTFGTPGLGEPWMGDSLQEVWWGSDDPEDPSSKTVCYVHPILYHGDNVMAKGKVVLRKAESKGKAAGKGKGSREGKREHKVYDMDEPEEEHKIAEAAAKATPRSRKLKK